MREMFKYSASFEELGISPLTLLNNSGQFASEQNDELMSIAAEAYDIGKNLANISCGIVLNDMVVDGDFVHTNTITLNIGKKITNLFKQASLGAFFVCTAGKAIEDVAHGLMAEGKIIEGYYVDLLGSLTVEAAMDRFQQQFAQSMSEQSLFVSNRYSPGYCDWHVSDQHQLFKLFPAFFCGVSLSESALMSPIKTVSGIMGVGTQVKHRDHHCDSCNSHTCIYRNINPKKQ